MKMRCRMFLYHKTKYLTIGLSAGGLRRMLKRAFLFIFDQSHSVVIEALVGYGIIKKVMPWRMRVLVCEEVC
jgi:hypothetical protein